MRFDLSDLELFLNIAEVENLTHGARRSALSPPAASARLKALEDRLRSRLFYRERHGLTLTPAGETLRRHARLITRQLEEVRNELTGSSAAASGHIRLFGNSTALTEVLPAVLAQFMVDQPLVSVDLQEKTTREVVRGILDGAADIGMVAGPVVTAGLTAFYYSTDRLVLVTPHEHPLARRSSIAFDKCLDHQHVGLADSTLHGFLNEMVARLGRRLSVRILMTSYEGMCRMIEAGVGIGVLPESTARRHALGMKLSIVALSDRWSLRERHVLVRDPAALTGSARRFLSALMDSCPASERSRGPRDALALP